MWSTEAESIFYKNSYSNKAQTTFANENKDQLICRASELVVNKKSDFGQHDIASTSFSSQFNQISYQPPHQNLYRFI